MLNGNRTKSNRGRSPRDLYITPLELAEAAIFRLQKDHEIEGRFPINSLDAGCGTGIWGKAVDGAFNVCGIDLVPDVGENDRYYEDVITGDFLTFNPHYPRYDLVFGNPPYSLAEQFFYKSIALSNDNGKVFFLLRLSFLEGMKRCRGLFSAFPMKRVYVCARRPSFFSSDGKRHTTDTLAYAMFLWQKGYAGKTELDFLNWEYGK